FFGQTDAVQISETVVQILENHVLNIGVKKFRKFEMGGVEETYVRLSLAQFTDHLSRSNTKRSNIHNNTTISNHPFQFRPTANSSMTTVL
ncbi:Chromo domain-containing protein, partial [Aphis craccivora]